MTNHYYSRTPEVKSDPQMIEIVLRDFKFRMKTDQGVFSKKEIDFGSRLLIDSFADNGQDGPLLDVGCGYGPIGLSMAKSFPGRTVHMVDVNERALGLAKENAEKNGIPNVSIYESSCFEKVNEKEFSAILTNPPIRAGKSVVHEILEDSYNHLIEGGELWVVIQKKQGAASAEKKMEGIYGNVEIAAKKKGYQILKSVKEN
ncbi:class I SAM-dependent methyltransferase [Rossellomorea vietnamensis]|uniref:Class I SAM-dependent methyltransferase n=1 Tax=Rossellomorea vietnamensis TaxID=218284 RepID=A0A5D4NHY8_9BACI|nr:class I SAM-dependent methyltransferase [Rossellomorea vietnamensis]TYS13883.1 class I SAM-dependent methyltransferase [Rossellomorea vietnamensis]